MKEPNYFCEVVKKRWKEKNQVIENEKAYLNLFKPVKNELIIGDASPSYLRDPVAPYLINKKIPHAKILISLRNPVERILSGYLMQKKWKMTELSFYDYIIDGMDKIQKGELFPPLTAGLYFDDVRRYLNIFDSDQVKIIIFEEWTKALKKNILDILEFLGLKDYYKIDYLIYNKYPGKEKPKLEHEGYKKLIEFYFEDVKLLQKLLKRKLPWIEFMN